MIMVGKFVNDKKAVSIWISWVLLLAFVISISAVMFNWSRSYSESQVERLIEISDTSECDLVGISVDDICQNPQTIEMTLTNRNGYSIDQIVVVVYDIYLQTLQTKKLNLSLMPSESENVILIKQGTTDQIKITPVFFTDDNIVHCNEKAATIEDIDFC
jgi:hypothetical protein